MLLNIMDPYFEFFMLPYILFYIYMQMYDLTIVTNIL